MTIAATVDATGIHAPSYEEILTTLQSAFRSIYGSDAYLGADSQDGQMLAVFAQAISDCNSTAVAVFNAFSPATAQGTGLSSVVQINGLTRRASSHSTADVTIVGQTGTVISNGIVSDDNENKWDLPASVTIPSGGSVVVTATAQEAGAIAAAIATITSITTPTRGWQTVSNPAAAVPGSAVETDAALRARQAVSTAISSISLFDSLIAAVKDLASVLEVQGYENDTDSADDNGIPAHSVALVVLGGDAAEIAAVIADKKNPGTGTYGTTSESVINASGAPLVVNFFRPTDVPITVSIDITRLSGYVSSTSTAIKQAVANYINALPIGAAPSQSVQWSKLFSAANGTGFESTYNVTSIELKRGADPLAAADVVLLFNENATSDVDDITVTES